MHKDTTENTAVAGSPGTARSFQDLHITNDFADSLGSEFYTLLPTLGLMNPRIVHVNNALAQHLGLSKELYQSPEFLAVMSGNQALPRGKTLAAVYSGHQFGVWAGQLGDGRAHLLGAITPIAPTAPSGTVTKQTIPATSSNRESPDVAAQYLSQNTSAQALEIQLKGAGLTPYSRSGDGRAVLRSSLREYLGSAAMQGLGIPTTQALSIVMSNDRVRRETVESAAVVARVAPSFVRFGSFQHWQAGQRPDLMEQLLHYVVDNFYPEIAQISTESILTLEDKTVAFMHEVVRRTASLMADWQAIGFVHGVMNTDNMSILGLTIDYGPFAFMDGFNARLVPNHSDSEGRYAWNRQPSIGLWNLYQLANALAALVQNKKHLKAALDTYEEHFSFAFRERMVLKFGLSKWQVKDQALLDAWWEMLHTQSADLTLSFRHLSKAWRSPDDFLSLFQDQKTAESWLEKYHSRVQVGRQGNQQREANMNSVNPLYILRSWMAQEAIEQVQTAQRFLNEQAKRPVSADVAELPYSVLNDPAASYLNRLMKVLANPYTEHEGCEDWAGQPPSWSASIALSCSS